MARGWESKSVEEQQAEASLTKRPSKRALTPEEVANQRKHEGLNLARRQVMEQLERAGNPRHREMLQSALAELDARLARLG
jgi:hypothetical protein